MKQMEIMKSSYKSEPNDLDPDFTGFKNSDALAISVEKKKQKIIQLKIQKDDPLNGSPPIVNSNHVDNKKRKSKSNVLFSPETLDAKNQNVNKRLKKDNLPSETVEPVEINVVQSIELSTPTFNLTSIPKPRRSVGRKINVDISDPIFKLPFEHGWKRELVYRTTGDYTSNRTNRNGDVYYYSPNNRKLRSLREIQEQLNLSLSDNNLLTIDSFTFLKQPIGINDRSKELIREANTKLSKEDSFSSNVNKSKKSKTPLQQELDHELSDNDNNKSSNKMKIVFKNTKKGSKSKSIKDKGSSETINTSITPDYVTEDWKAIQSASATPLAEPVKVDEPAQNNVIDKTRNAEINGSIRNTIELLSSLQTFNYLAGAMKYVFKHLKVHDLLVASRVCQTWKLIAMQEELWQNVRLKNSMVYDWNKFVDTINKKDTVSLDTRRMLIPKNNFDGFWLCFSKDLKRAVKLKTIELYRCPTHVVEDIIYSLPQLEVLNASSIKNPLLTKDVKHTNDFMTLSLKYLSSVQNLTEIRLKGLSGIKLTELPTFKNLTNLRTLSLTSIKSFPKDTCRALDSITTNLEHLAIGDCDCLFKDFAGSLRKLFNLKSLRLENCGGSSWNLFSQETFRAIRSLEKLRVLELINIDFTNTVEEELEKCCGVRSLLIIPAYISQSATTNCHLIECLKKLAPTLTHVIWGLTNELLRVTDLFISQYQENKHTIGYHLELNDAGQPSIPILKSRRPKQQSEDDDSDLENDQKSDNVDIMSVPALEKLLETMMVCAKTKLIKVAFSGTTRVYLNDYFNDL